MSSETPEVRAARVAVENAMSRHGRITHPDLRTLQHVAMELEMYPRYASGKSLEVIDELCRLWLAMRALSSA